MSNVARCGFKSGPKGPAPTILVIYLSICIIIIIIIIIIYIQKGFFVFQFHIVLYYVTIPPPSNVIKLVGPPLVAYTVAYSNVRTGKPMALL